MAGLGRYWIETRHLGGHRAACGQGREGIFQAGVERGRVDAPGQVPEVRDGLLGAAVRFVDQAPDGVQIGGLAGFGANVAELLLRLAEPHRQGHQLGLGAVVQVALDALESLRGRVERPRPRYLEASHPGRRGVGAEQEVHQLPVEVDDQPHGPWRDEQEHRRRSRTRRRGRQTRLPRAHRGSWHRTARPRGPNPVTPRPPMNGEAMPRSASTQTLSANHTPKRVSGTLATK